MTNRSAGQWKLPQPIDIKEDNKWVSIPKIARTIPFGYGVDDNDPDVLNPIQIELDNLELARQHIKQYSFRQVANWITKKTDREISHVGLRKRLMYEKQRKNQARTLKRWSEYAEKAIEKAKAIEEERTGARA